MILNKLKLVWHNGPRLGALKIYFRTVHNVYQSNLFTSTRQYCCFTNSNYLVFIQSHKHRVDSVSLFKWHINLRGLFNDNSIPVEEQ